MPVALPQQQQSHERASILRYTCVSFLVYFKAKSPAKHNIRSVLFWYVHYGVNGGNSLPTRFRDNLSFLSSIVKKLLFTLEDGTDRLSRNVDKDSPPYAA